MNVAILVTPSGVVCSVRAPPFAPASSRECAAAQFSVAEFGAARYCALREAE
jgi:hypothetical protein